MMRPHARLLLCLGSISMAVVLMCAAERLKAQAEAAKGKTEEAQTAEQKFKNIQVLRGIPEDQLTPSMQFISASLGVECEFCHVQRAMEKDDKKPKLTARKMMTMMMQINADSFKNEREVAGKKYPIEIYSQAPDSRVSISHLPSGPSVTAFNGEAGWLSSPNGIRRMSSAEQQAARIDAELYFPLQLPRMYQEFEASSGELINGKATYLVSAKGKDTPSLRLYFEQESGLLVRLIRFAETPLGRNPTEIDYADFRVADGVKLSYRWTLARPNGRFTIQIDAVKQNVPLDEGQFVTPSIQEEH